MLQNVFVIECFQEEGDYMKKIAILGSGSDWNFIAITEYFREKDVDITCLSDNINSDILKTSENLEIKHQYLPFDDNAAYFAARDFDLIVLAEYARTLPTDIIELGRFVNVHPSLLPSFKGADAISRAFLSGVKVSGVTVHWVTNEPDGGKIIAQYPVLISNLMHFDEFEAEIHKLEQILYPKVIEAILEDKVFDFSDLFDSGCNKGCGGCGGCH